MKPLGLNFHLLTMKLMKLNKLTKVSYIMWYLFYSGYKYEYTIMHGHNTIDHSIIEAY